MWVTDVPPLPLLCQVNFRGWHHVGISHYFASSWYCTFHSYATERISYSAAFAPMAVPSPRATNINLQITNMRKLSGFESHVVIFSCLWVNIWNPFSWLTLFLVFQPLFYSPASSSAIPPTPNDISMLPHCLQHCDLRLLFVPPLFCLS